MKRSEAFTENPGDRLDSEFFLKETLRVFQLIKQFPNDHIFNLVEKVQHPRELERNYEDQGLHVILAQNIRDNYFEFMEKAFMSENVRAVLATNHVKTNDILMTRSGANYGQTATWVEQDNEAFACADLLIFREPKCPAGYLSSFFTTSHGKRLIDRGSYGMAQPHIAPSYLETIRIPRFSSLEKRVDSLVKKSVTKFHKANEHIEQAEQTLLHALGLENWQPPEPLTYTSRASDAFAAGRLDAEHFQPKYDALILALRTAEGSFELQPLGELSKPLKYGCSTQLDYVEEGLIFLRIADLENKQFALGSVLRVPMATKFRESDLAQEDDVLISRSGTLGIAVPITKEFSGAAYGSYFIRTRPERSMLHPEFLSLFINSYAGQMQVEGKNTGGVQTNLTIPAIESIWVPVGPMAWQMQFVKQANSAHAARRKAHALLDAAKRAVEIAIEHNEQAALEYLAAIGETT